MVTKRWLIPVLLLIIFMLGLLSIMPVPTPAEKDCLTATGTVVQIYESGTRDVSLALAGQRVTFYVNRGLERGLDLEVLRSTLINNEVLIKYPQYWTPLDPGNSIRHVSKIEMNGQIIFNELKGAQ